MNKQELVKELIRVLRKYYTTRDTDLFPKISEIKNKLESTYKMNWHKISFISDLAKHTIWLNKPIKYIYDTYILWFPNDNIEYKEE